jgi:hypothetical protein
MSACVYLCLCLRCFCLLLTAFLLMSHVWLCLWLLVSASACVCVCLSSSLLVLVSACAYFFGVCWCLTIWAPRIFPCLRVKTAIHLLNELERYVTFSSVHKLLNVMQFWCKQKRIEEKKCSIMDCNRKRQLIILHDLHFAVYICFKTVSETSHCTSY